ncbi:MAG: hypothetical protein KDA28_16940, partial [Phycisphaerales bacterium]|nr:hypothetical protein [Phycisphaerales bacterium]
MNLQQFFEHWQITENPFRGEEARHDDVFARMGGETTHSDFEKIVGQLARPSTSIVFGEKGSGKTAIRLQLERALERHNQTTTDQRVLLVAYDDLNGALDRLHDRVGGETPLDSFREMTLVDHMDAILAAASSRFTTAILDGSVRDVRARLDRTDRLGLLLVQAVYDGADDAHDRTRRLRRLLRLGKGRARAAWLAGSLLGWIVPAGIAFGAFRASADFPGQAWQIAFVAALVLWLLVLLRTFWVDQLLVARRARRVSKHLRMLGRPVASLQASLGQLQPQYANPLLPVNDNEEVRYAMLDRLRRVMGRLGYTGMLVVIDRVDEPTLVSGDAERMRAIIWPLLNNKFLQQTEFGVKMLLPIELRHALFKESSSFFQEARLDKQNLIERLTWTGAMLYDLCDARLRACRPEEAPVVALLDLFAEDVTRRDVVDALDQMHQPRDA